MCCQFSCLQIVIYDFISRIQNDHLLVPLTGPFAMKTAGVCAQSCVWKRNLKRCCDVEIKKLANAVKEKEPLGQPLRQPPSQHPGQDELVDAVDTLTRAVGIFERELAKKSATFAQIDTSSMQKMSNGLRTVNAADLGLKDRSKSLTKLLLVDVLNDIKAKAEAELADLRHVLDFEWNAILENEMQPPNVPGYTWY